MIKRKGLLASAAAASIALAGCNFNPIGTYKYKGIHVLGLKEGRQCDLPIQAWSQEEGTPGVEVKIDGVWCYFSEGTYILLGDPDNCPICDMKGD